MYPQKVLSNKTFSQWYGSADPDPDPNKNVMDPQRWLKSRLLIRSVSHWGFGLFLGKPVTIVTAKRGKPNIIPKWHFLN
jgi:hypothetical protein